MVPDAATSSRVGPAYTSRVAEFAVDYWRPDVALENSDSLRRCIERVREFAEYIRNGVIHA
jgi:hypothetical protein